MKTCVSVAAVACAMAVATGAAGAVKAARAADLPATALPVRYHPAQLLVRIRPGLDETRRNELLVGAGAVDVVRKYSLVPGLICISTKHGETAVVKKMLERLEEVMYVEGDAEGVAAAQSTPTGVAAVRAPQCWVRTRGAGVRVAVLDTGVSQSHPDLPTAAASASFISGESVQDLHGHGTHMAGVALARDNDIGVIGVAPAAALMVGKVLANSGAGNNSTILAGLEWAAHEGAHVVNLSIQGMPFSQAMADMLNAASDRMLIVACAGNSGSLTPSYPGAYESVVCVSAVEGFTFTQWGLSNMGPHVDVCAPGVIENSTYLGTGYTVLSGTSISSANVSGVAALVWGSAWPRTPTAAQVRRAIEESCRDLGSAGRDNVFGMGLVNADAAVSRLAEIMGPGCVCDIANDAGVPLATGGWMGSNGGVNEGDYNAFFTGFFAAAGYCDIADDAGRAPAAGPNRGVNEGDFNAFFMHFFAACA